MTEVLVTGGTGFIGAQICRSLVDDGQAVRLLVRSATRLPAELRHHPLIRCVEGDVTWPASLGAALRGVSRVVHCAVWPANTDWLQARRVNVGGTAHLLAAAAAAGVERVICLSNCAVYGLKAVGELTEAAPLLPSDDPYCDTKVEAEQLCREATAQGLPITVLRLPAVYGPGSRLWTEQLGEQLLARRFPLLDGGAASFACTYIDDAVAAVRLALERPAAAGQVYNVIGQQATLAAFAGGYAEALQAPPPVRLPSWPVRAAAALVAAGYGALGRTPPISPRTLDMLLIRCTYNGERFRQLGWRPRVSLEEGLRRAAAWYRSLQPKGVGQS